MLPNIEDIEHIEIAEFGLFPDYYMDQVDQGKLYVITQYGEVKGVLMPYALYEYYEKLKEEFGDPDDTK